MYPSDYGYASTDTTCRSNLYSYDCKNNNWMFNSAYQWTLSPYSDSARFVFVVYSGGLVGNNASYNTRGVRPALFLKSDVLITSGTGTSTDPYTLK